jgi:hypothetical protein
MIMRMGAIFERRFKYYEQGAQTTSHATLKHRGGILDAEFIDDAEYVVHTQHYTFPIMMKGRNNTVHVGKSM